ncbi:hypothetical protein CW304_10080 [Bacillus sp. UFRGS-B20]|nr:hypothetical protein CW304_10080 [Bacillus sp. UFRGS-B20]
MNFRIGLIGSSCLSFAFFWARLRDRVNFCRKNTLGILTSIIAFVRDGFSKLAKLCLSHLPPANFCSSSNAGMEPFPRLNIFVPVLSEM